jgi:multidrug efflux system outer membrane protein
MPTVVVCWATRAALLAGSMRELDDQQPAGPVLAQDRSMEQLAPGREAVSLAERQWCALFQDEHVQALVRTALENNSDVRTAAVRQLEATAQLRLTRSFLLPAVDEVAAVSGARGSQEHFRPLSSGTSPAGNTCALGLALTWQVCDAERDLCDVALHLARLQRNERLNLVERSTALGGGWEAVRDPEKGAFLSRPDRSEAALPPRLHHYWLVCMCTRAPPAHPGVMRALASTNAVEH